MNYEEIEARLAAIPAECEAEGADLDALEKEVKTLKEERQKIVDAAEKRKALINEVNERGAFVPTIKEESHLEERTFGLDSAEYRSAWLKKLAGQELNEVEQRAYASTDTNNAIPTTVSTTFFEQMKKLAPMLSEITLMQVAGNIKFIAEGTRNAATLHTENTSVTPAADTVIEVNLGAFEFVKIITISKLAQNQNIDAFETWLVDMLAGDIARAVDNYIINDSTNGIVAITYSTGTNQILNTTTYTYANITSLIAMLPASYDAEAKFLVNKATLYNHIANITDTAGNPIFVPNTEEGMRGRLMGYPVIVDDYVATANNGLYLGRWKDIVGNLSIPMQVDSNENFRGVGVDFRGYAAFDSKPAKKDGIIRLVSTAS